VSERSGEGEAMGQFLVDRLRSFEEVWASEAADEIERLAADNARLRADKDNWEKVSAAAIKEQFRLDAEIVQLRVVLQDLVDRWADERGMDQEIERARALLMENALRYPADSDVRRALEGKE
jgi:hypothetical protein